MSDETGPTGDERQPPRTVRRAPRWMVILLIVSAALNLLVIGAVVGRVAMGGWHHWGWGVGREFWHELPSERREMLRGLLMERAPDFRRDAEAAREAARALADAIAATPYDRARVEAALARLDGALDGLRSSGQQMMFEALERLTPAERQSLAEIIRTRVDRWERWRRWH